MEARTQKRGTRQFPLALELQFKIKSPYAVVVGVGRTVLVGSKEIIFRADRTLLPGTELELAIAWPVLLENRVGLQLIVVGRVIRAEGESITASIGRYQFRTRALAREPRVSNNSVALPPAELLVRSWRAAREAYV